MANKEIHELITAEELSASDVIAEQRESGGTWLTRKLTFNALGLFLNKVLQFASDLNTTNKTIIGAINELAQGSGQSLDTLNDVDIDAQTLADGQGIVYDATAQKWKNGAVSGGGHAYSTTEHIVGTWIDGSPVYEKTIYCDAFPNNTSKDLSTPSDIDMLIDAEGFMKSTTLTGYFRTLPFAAGGTNDVRVDLNGGILRVVTFSDWSSYDGYITIRYTKSST